jgi:glycosyltransferase involved in cell wall biosynthesis
LKIVLATTMEPFVDGGANYIADSLEETLLMCGHQVEVLRLPFYSSYKVMLEQMLALRLLDVTGAGDRLIAIRTPSYLLRHPRKTLWFIHHHRGAYDLWGTEYGDLPDTTEGRRYREAIVRADNIAFAEAKHIFTNSQVVSDRLKTYNQVESKVLYPPLLNPQQYAPKEYGDFFLYISRIVRHKRQHLAIEALKHTRTRVRLVVAGPANDPSFARELQLLSHRLGVSDRVKILSSWISHEQKLGLLADCLGMIYLPFEEDSYGYAALEAQQSAKAVVVSRDSGGALELIRDGVNGFVAGPDPAELGAALDRLYVDRDLARRMGQAGRARIAELGIGWDRVIACLLA